MTTQTQTEWSKGAQAWADYMEPQFISNYEAVFKDLNIKPGMALLDMGCGTGLACHMAAQKGAKVSGMDLSPDSIEIAKKKTPQGEFAVSDIEKLPFADGKFDAVTGFNSFQFAVTPVNALKEARRVTKSGGRLAILIWEKQDRQDAIPAFFSVIRSFLPPPPPGAPGPFALSAEGLLETKVKEAGWKPGTLKVIESVWTYANLEASIKAIMGAGVTVKAVEAAGEEPVKQALMKALGAFKQPSGEIRLRNEFQYLVATN